MVTQITSPISALEKKNRRISSVFLNDDAAERKQRRASVLDSRKRRISLFASRSPSSETISGQSATPSTLKSSGVSLPAVNALSTAEINQRYEEWMKIAADNVSNTNPN